jgi:hypothetical protein
MPSADNADDFAALILHIRSGQASRETFFKAQMVSFCHELNEFFEFPFRIICAIRGKGFRSTSASRRLALSGVLGCERQSKEYRGAAERSRSMSVRRSLAASKHGLCQYGLP